MRFFAIVVVVAIGCSRSDPQATPATLASTPKRDVDERVTVLEPLRAEIIDMLRRARAKEVCLVSFGEVDADGRVSRGDPPAEYLRMLQEIRANTIAGSAGEFRDDTYWDKTTGQAGVLISIDFDRTKGAHEVDVSLGFRRNGLDGFGWNLRLKKDGNKWVIDKRLSSWVS